MNNILLISEIQGYLAITTQEKLQSFDFKVISTKNDASEIDKIKDQLCAIVVYCSEDLVSDRQFLIYLKDKALEDDVMVFAVGNSAELKAVEEVIPKQYVKSMQRPINVNELAEAINTHIEIVGTAIKKKILVVDDSGAMLRNVKAWLGQKYQVIPANSGAMAIKYLAMNRPDLILLDYEMPICDGKQVLEMIRSEKDFADIPVIFLTSKGDKESVMNVMALKPEGYLLKTMEPYQIVKAVNEFFEKRKAQE